jgi:hypothetical protein
MESTTKLKSLEHTEQVNLMQWWALACRGFGIPEQLLFAIPNGGQRNIIVASKLKAEGVRAGVPDLFLAFPKKDAAGLFIEMKKPTVAVHLTNKRPCSPNSPIMAMPPPSVTDGLRQKQPSNIT